MRNREALAEGNSRALLLRNAKTPEWMRQRSNASVLPARNTMITPLGRQLSDRLWSRPHLDPA